MNRLGYYLSPSGLGKENCAADGRGILLRSEAMEDRTAARIRLREAASARHAAQAVQTYFEVEGRRDALPHSQKRKEITIKSNNDIDKCFVMF